MKTSILNGGLPKARAIPQMTGPEFAEHIISTRRFTGSVSDEEWALLRQFPSASRATQLVAMLVALRQMPRYPLPADHPLNPSSRYREA